jgi:predicted nuclease of predicted toxin-antitoxin system
VKFLLDQNLSPKTKGFLQEMGIDVKDVRDVGLTGAPDEQVYAFAKAEEFMVVTYNSDFSRKYIFEKDLPGLILLRVHPQTVEVLHPVLKDFFSKISPEQIQHSIAVVERHRYRLRKLK